ncbi:MULTISPECIES: DUF3914 domain-containing protein [unclassified Bacillus cereus group]|uniref:DUF3914 domain-containing protein n=1 Tax=unclassified Bacillus cereus group TaxID=2750818 RepID=UPI001F5A2EA8|nr:MULTISPECIES: DUF3914 domain-containing protein [unclassified Bacillus cereus group]
MKIGWNVNAMSQHTKVTPLNIAQNENQNVAISEKEKKQDDGIKFDIRSSEKTTHQAKHKFTEVDLWKMLKDKGVPMWIIFEVLQKFRKEKEATNATQHTSNAFEAVNETRLNEVM